MFCLGDYNATRTQAYWQAFRCNLLCSVGSYEGDTRQSRGFGDAGNSENYKDWQIQDN